MEIGLKSSFVVGRSIFGTGYTLDNFHSDGKHCWWIEELMMLVSGPAIFSATISVLDGANMAQNTKQTGNF